jgi:hypothetical protein
MHDPGSSAHPLTPGPGTPGLGVPLSVWPASPPTEAARAVTEFSRPGDLIVVLDAGTGTVLSSVTAAAAGRRVLGLAAGHFAGLRLDQAQGPAGCPLTQIRLGEPGVLLDPASPHAGQAALAITAVPPEGRGEVYAACARALRPGGILVVLNAPASAPGVGSAAALAAARAAGLVYVQHVIALRVPLAGGQLIPPAGAAPPPGAVCARVHSDVLVLSKPGGTA